MSLRHRAEFVSVWLLIHFLGALPRKVARAVGAGVAAFAYLTFSRLRCVGKRNLFLAFPERNEAERNGILRGEYRHLGHLLAEFCQMSHYTREFTSSFIRYDGLHRLLQAKRGRGALILTGHLGAWELSSFFHALMGHPMGMVIRRLDNPLVDDLVNRIRCLHGNRVIHKDDFARGLLDAMRSGETVGILMDTNITPPQGVFAPFFGVPACTAVGMARIARKTGAAVLPGFLFREAIEDRYVLHFGEELELQRTEDLEADALANTALFNRVLETYIRKYPDQWLWLHRRWKTRPTEEQEVY